jgi:hypothetical protein
MKKIFFTILVIFYSNTLNAQESYLCISEAIGGVAYDSSLNKWDGTKFSNNNHKIILKKKMGVGNMLTLAITLKNHAIR